MLTSVLTTPPGHLGTPVLNLVSTPITLPECPLHRAPWWYPALHSLWLHLPSLHGQFSFSCPSRVPSGQIPPGPLSLHPFQFQLSCQSTLCTEDPGMTQSMSMLAPVIPPGHSPHEMSCNTQFMPDTAPASQTKSQDTCSLNREWA